MCEIMCKRELKEFRSGKIPLNNYMLPKMSKFKRPIRFSPFDSTKNIKSLFQRQHRYEFC